MSEVLPSNYIYGIILFTLITVGGIAMLAELNKSDPAILQTEEAKQFNKSFNKLDELTTQVDSLEQGLQQSDEDSDFGTFGVLNALINKAWQTLRLLGNSFGFMESAYTGLSTVFGVPAWIPGIIALLVTIMIAFGVYAAIFQKRV